MMERAALVFLLAAALAGGGCVHSIATRTGQPLPDWPASVEGETYSLAIARWTLHTVQRFDMQTQYSTDYITQTWKETPGEKDKSPLLYEALLDAGVQQVTFQVDESADYYVAGYFTSEDSTNVGLFCYNIVFAFFPTVLFSPIPPWLLQRESDMVVSVYDSQGRLVKSRKVFLGDFILAFGYYGLVPEGKTAEEKFSRIGAAIALDLIAGRDRPEPGGEERSSDETSN